MKTNYFKTVLAFSALIILSHSVIAGVISGNSTIQLSIKGVPTAEQAQISGPYVVSPDGFVHLPHIKQGIKAGGKTNNNLERIIESAYRNAEIYNNARITIITAKTAENEKLDAQFVTVGGNVTRPGPVAFTRDMTIFNAVTAAGGKNAFGAINRVELVRNGKRYVYNLKEIKDMGLRVYPKDVINVPQKDWKGQ